jgi:hypothetical protein
VCMSVCVCVCVCVCMFALLTGLSAFWQTPVLALLIAKVLDEPQLAP